MHQILHSQIVFWKIPPPLHILFVSADVCVCFIIFYIQISAVYRTMVRNLRQPVMRVSASVCSGVRVRPFFLPFLLPPEHNDILGKEATQVYNIALALT